MPPLTILSRRYVLDQILSGEATEVVVENIHEYLTTMGEDVRAGKIKPDEFIIFKVSTSSAYRVKKCSPAHAVDNSDLAKIQRTIRMRRASRTSRLLSK